MAAAAAAAASFLRRESSRAVVPILRRPMLPSFESSVAIPIIPPGPVVPSPPPSVPGISSDSVMDLMAVPKKKVSRFKKGLRNGPKALKPVPVIVRCNGDRGSSGSPSA